MEFTNLFIGFLINLLIAVFIVRGIYFPAKQNKNYVFTYIAFNSIIYFVMAFLTSSELSLGVGFGLFAIFSILRYRTSTMSTREMTYLFIVIALPVINSILVTDNNWLMMVCVSGAIIAVLYVLEHEWGFHYESSKMVRYEQIELIKPENYLLLLEDLRERIGLPITRAEVGPDQLFERHGRN